VPKQPKKSISISAYLDYRQFLRDRFLELKAKYRGYSYRAFSRQAGIRSSGFLKMLIDGQRNLTEKTLPLVAKGLHLSSHEMQLLRLIVRYQHALDPKAKEETLQELRFKKSIVKPKRLLRSHAPLFTHWYQAAITQMLRIKTDSPKDEVWIYNHITPQVDLLEIRRAIANLLKIGIIERTKRGDVKIKEEMMLSADNDSASPEATRFHIAMSDLAKRALIREKEKRRECTTLTIALSRADFKRLKEKIREFRDQLYSFVEQSQEAKEIVAHINFQLFRLSKRA